MLPSYLSSAAFLLATLLAGVAGALSVPRTLPALAGLARDGMVPASALEWERHAAVRESAVLVNWGFLGTLAALMVAYATYADPSGPGGPTERWLVSAMLLAAAGLCWGGGIVAARWREAVAAAGGIVAAESMPLAAAGTLLFAGTFGAGAVLACGWMLAELAWKLLAG